MSFKLSSQKINYSKVSLTQLRKYVPSEAKQEETNVTWFENTIQNSVLVCDILTEKEFAESPIPAQLILE